MSSSKGTEVVVRERERPASEGEADHGSKKRVRRRRGGQKRFKPYMDLDPIVGPSNESPEMSNRRRSARLKGGRPMAPYNTTQFLLADREQRADMDAADEAAYMDQERRRVRSFSVGSEQLLEELASSSGTSEEDDELDGVDHREFEDVYEEIQIDRCSKMNREELTREVLGATKDKDYILNELIRVNNENRRLKQLLEVNGIDAKVV